MPCARRGAQAALSPNLGAPAMPAPWHTVHVVSYTFLPSALPTAAGPAAAGAGGAAAAIAPPGAAAGVGLAGAAGAGLEGACACAGAAPALAVATPTEPA